MENKTSDLMTTKNNKLGPELKKLIDSAVEKRVSDIHIDSLRDKFLVRFRIDGQISVHEELPVGPGKHLINQIRVASDITLEHVFVPLEGHFVWQNGNDKKDIRVTIVPANYAQALHIRILTPPENLKNIENLGFTEKHLNTLRQTLKKPEGLILISGPTGGGKTTTLYSLVSLLNLKNTAVVSIEDPIEFYIPGIRQVEVNEAHKLTMARGLRSLLRMDPDLILVGEIRDSDSAVTALRAASAGRFVFTTIHARDTAAAVESLHNLDVPFSILGSSLRLLISQNLVRRVCSCAVERKIRPEEKKLFEKAEVKPPSKVKYPKGCSECGNTGYKGLVGVFEIIQVDEKLSYEITKGIDQYELRKLIRNYGIKTLVGDALTKAAEGVTTMDEVYQIYWPGGIDSALEPDFKAWSKMRGV